ncbi:autotransporter domain-containing protein [Chlamydia muridarum str. Nigg]|uniref:Probable outer membrane protein PmpF n=2 Tax=Chlamydia muridarum TaxID=83560 RepID=PMPF_CHLMU|nr:polymorphic outer membrane protein middle domain-containing protein [Chlamydia muridarum]Q9PL46.1 RecName: Full=Probable outer membrane protein PmpF; AltName: Full=Polymorphic membrane protein F; Flags: Precursor [Chlamydia muridarum str. Nigg]UFT32680.1 autotransporter domain-containing protein [Chlamydia trachomatis]AAF39131.1 polymorphic membrane protein E/F family [Chlamydia muridarum str. Nigg]AHH22653.1 membrane protein [Chlamydia muridarum str. Nigg3 CMUT3-5]AHH23577.1 membrane prote
MTRRILPLSLVFIPLSCISASETDTLKLPNLTFGGREIEFIVTPPSSIAAQYITYANVSNYRGNFTISSCTQDQWFSRGLSTTNSSGAFVESMTSFTAIDNADLFFCNNYCTHQGGGGAINATGLISFKNNQNILFYNNTTIGTQFTGVALRTERNRGGALYGSSIELINNHSLNFINNTSGDMGGAVSTIQNLVIKNTSGIVAFENNHTTDHIPNTFATILARGGAVGCQGACEISHNTGPVVFNSNYGGYGGAISTGGQCIFRDNKDKLIFINNSALGWHNTSAQGNGAVISAGGEFGLLNNKGPIYFENNNASYIAGAISCNNLNFQENGPIYFLNNSALYGGAFHLFASPAANYIHTGSGDIIFNNNTELSTTGMSAGLRKLFYIPGTTNNNPITLSLGAKKDTRIYFYDLFQWGGLKKANTPPENSPHTVTINPSDEFSGAVVFSYKNISSDLQAHMIASKTHNQIKDSPTTLKFGTMSIENGAEFEFFNGPLTQESTSLLALGQDSILTVGKDASLTITHLGIILPGLLNDQGTTAPRIRVNPQDMTQNTNSNQAPVSTENVATQKIFFSGLVSLVDENYESVYDSCDLSRGKANQPILHIETTNDAQLSNDWKNTLNTSLYSLPHYGYQGLWTSNWMTTTRTVSLTNSTETQTANNSIQEQKNTSETFDSNSTTTAKIPSIRASTGGTTPLATTDVTVTRHSLVVSWTPIGYIADPARRGDLIANNLVSSGRNTTLYLRSLLPDDSWFALQGSAATLFTKQQKRLDYHGYSSASKGYAISSQASGAHGHKFLFSFSQSSDTMKEKRTNNKISSRYYLSALCFEQPMFDRIALIGAAAYNYGTHKTYNFYGTKKFSKGNFHSTTLGGSLRCELRDSMPFQSIMLTPFIQALISRTEPASIQEQGDLARLFSLKQPHTAVVSPIGIKGVYSSNKWPTVSCEMEVAYQPTLYWKRPILNTVLIKNNGSWETTNTPLAKHSFYGRGSSSLKFSYLKLFANYQAQVATSTVSHYMNAGGALVF